MRNTAQRILFTLVLSLGALACASNPGEGNSNASNLVKVGSFVARYDPILGVDYQMANIKSTAGTASSKYALDYANSTGVADGAIKDHSLNSQADINYTMGLVDPDSCTSDYNNTTHVLSFYAKLVNKSNYLNDWTGVQANCNPVTKAGCYEFTNLASFPRNTTFYAPFYYVITGMDWNTFSWEANPPVLVTAINTNLQGSACNGANGLTLASCDGSGIFGQVSANNRFDLVYPDNPVNNYVSLPGWDYTPYVTGGDMIPGEDTGCTLFMQYTLTQNQPFILYFDLMAVKQNGGAPAAPTVTTPTNNSYANSNPITLTVTNCPAGGTLYVDGGSAQASAACNTTTKSVSVTLRSNQLNTLSAYYINTGLQGPAAIINVTHDNVAPTLVSWVPANNETVVGTVSRCVATFNEPMDTATFNAGTVLCTTANFAMCDVILGTVVAGAITYSSDKTQAVYTPTSALTASRSYTCNAKTGTAAPTTLRDLAGNALSPISTITFTTGASGQDVTPPYVKAIFPADNSTISPTSSFFIYFSEPIQPSTVVGGPEPSFPFPASATDCDLGTSNPKAPNIAVFQTASCPLTLPPARPNRIDGRVTLNATGDVATFTPTGTTPATTMKPNDCIAITVGGNYDETMGAPYNRCTLGGIKDLAGNSLAYRGSFAIGAYPNSDYQSNSWNIFYTSTTPDTTGPNLVHVGPMLGATGARNRVFPFVIFNEAIDINTIISNYFYMTVFGNPVKLPLTLKADPTFQMVTYKTGSNLSTSTNHVITATGAVADTSGNLMPSPQTSSFTTAATADTTVPTVVKVTPTNGSNASRCTFVDIDFSEPMNETTLNGATLTLVRVGALTPKNQALDLRISDDGMHVRMIPQSSLRASACGTGNNDCKFTVTITGGANGVKDRAGNAMAATYTGTTFTAVADATAPTITAFVPPNGSTVSNNGSFAIFFSEPMDRTTLTDTNVALTGVPFQSVFPSDDGKWMVVNGYHNMAGGSQSLTLSNADVRDRHINSNGGNCENGIGGNTLTGTTSINFTVGGGDTTAPTVSSVSPTDRSTSVSTAIVPSVTFSEAIDPRTVLPSTIFLMDQQGNIVNSTISFNATATVVTLTPVQALTNPGIYYIVGTTALRDLGGGNAYDGNGGETISNPGVLRTCFSTSSTACP